MLKNYLGQTHAFTYARQLTVKNINSLDLYAHRNGTVDMNYSGFVHHEVKPLATAEIYHVQDLCTGMYS